MHKHCNTNYPRKIKILKNINFTWILVIYEYLHFPTSSSFFFVFFLVPFLRPFLHSLFHTFFICSFATAFLIYFFEIHAVPLGKLSFKRMGKNAYTDKYIHSACKIIKKIFKKCISI